MATLLQLLGVVAFVAGLCLFGLPGAVVALGTVLFATGLILEFRKTGDG